MRKSAGEGDAIVPRVKEEMKPARRRMERMPRFWEVCGTEIRACRARKAFWTCAQRADADVDMAVVDIFLGF